LIPATVVILMLLLALGLPVASVLAILGLTLGDVLAGLPLHRAMGEIAWSANSEVIIVAIPLFVLMGEILLRSGVAARMYDSAVQWMSWLPGGLMHSNIGACTIFAATSGSSAATAATIGTVAIPEMRKHGYHQGLFLGTLAAGGTPVDLEFAYTRSAQAKLVLTAHEVYLPKPKLAVGGPGGVQASFDFRGAKNDVAGRMLTVTLTNDLDGTEYA
jgi:hypothetical protein